MMIYKDFQKNSCKIKTKQLPLHSQNTILSNMARPIEKTPTMTGKDALRFRQSLLKSLTLSYPREEIERQKQELQEMKKFYQEFVTVTNGTF